MSFFEMSRHGTVSQGHLSQVHLHLDFAVLLDSTFFLSYNR